MSSTVATSRRAHREDSLLNQRGGFKPQDVAAENLAVRGNEHLHLAGEILCPPERTVRIPGPPDAIGLVTIAKFGFRDPDGPDLRLREDRVGHRPVIDRAALAVDDVVDRVPRFVIPGVFEEELSGHVTLGPDPWLVSLQVLVRGEEATLVSFEGRVLQAEVVGVRLPTDGDEALVARNPGLCTVLVGSGDDDALGSRLDGCGPPVEKEIVPLCGPLGELQGDLPVLAVEECRPGVNDRDIGSHKLEKIAQFSADVPATDHDQTLGLGIQIQGLPTGQQRRLLETLDWRHDGTASGRDENPFGLDSSIADVDDSIVHEAGVLADEFEALLSVKIGSHPLGNAFEDRLDLVHDSREVDFLNVGVDAEPVSPLDGLHHRRPVDQRLRRIAAAVETGPPRGGPLRRVRSPTLPPRPRRRRNCRFPRR